MFPFYSSTTSPLAAVFTRSQSSLARSALGLVGLLLLLISSGDALAQRPARPQPQTPAARPAPPAARPPAARPPAARATAKKAERPAMRTLELPTKDGLQIRAFYFPSIKGKEAIPVVVMHEWQGQASPYQALVGALWDLGCAVIVPEFRGHGGSRTQAGGRELDVSRMGKGDVMAMITGDLEAVKKFLVVENNEQRLNLNALTLVGIREGAILASHWAVADLNFPSLGTVKQGQDVKAMVLISPTKGIRRIRGISLDETLNDRLFVQLPFLIVVGDTSSQAADTERFYQRLESMKKRARRGEPNDLRYEQLNTPLDGPALVNDVPGVIDQVRDFVDQQMVSRSGAFPWTDRP